MALPCVSRLQALRLSSRTPLFRCLCRSSSHQAADVKAIDEIDIPRKKTWDKTAVLQALAYTVNHDPTSAAYIFQDDPFLLPKSYIDCNIFSMSKESGKNAAKYILNMYPNLFQNDIAEPHIPCLMPEDTQTLIEGVSEEALNERIKLRRVKESVEMYDNLLQSGTTPSLETTNRLLDLLCFYGDRDPLSSEQKLEDEEREENGNETNKKKGDSRNTPALPTWRENNNAERIFSLMPERNAHSYRTMIRGMVKHGAFAKAFSMYTDLLNNRLTGDVYTFNALIMAAPHVKKEIKAKSTLILDMLHHMVQQKVQPNILTFNAALKSLQKIGRVMKSVALRTYTEMKALNIEPSLATYTHLLGVFYSYGDATGQAQILSEILEETAGKSFTAQDPDDVYFFLDAMKICVEAKDLELAYKVHALQTTEENWKLLGKHIMQITYYDRLFNIICLMESFDAVMKWYRELVPSRLYPSIGGFVNLLRVLEMENRLDLLPQIWKDVKLVGHNNKVVLVEEFLNLMVKDKMESQLQAAFADVTVDMKSTFDTRDQLKHLLKVHALGNMAILLSRDGRLEEAWNILKTFKEKNLVPRLAVIEELLDSAKATGRTSAAIDLVQLAVSFSLPNTAEIAQRVLDEFTVSEEQRIALQDLTNSSSSSSSSSSDSDRE
ncbi:small ribosomal subunit protein mS39 [Pseudophryne corroboree]|uniref:small ribosomal subunit protein mS39 n=1 Tax=Pseudophryne corroboree TaxID=495146 RepID=UPI003082048D